MEWRPGSEYDVTVAEKAEPVAVPDPGAAVRSALDQPLDTPPLEHLAAGARSATIVVTDVTRPCPDHWIVPALAERLIRSGIPETAITVLVAIGMHRPSTEAEKIAKLGAETRARFQVVDSEPLDPLFQADLGITVHDTPVRIDRRAVETDLLISTGIVEPHQYAGFSGGWKTVAIGTASSETIAALHGMHYLEHPGVRLAATDQNPFLDDLRRIGERAGLRFVVNVALDSAGRITRVEAGHPETVHRMLSGWVRDMSRVPLESDFSIVIGGAGHPKDSNLYQATRIPTYLCLAARPVVRRGGVVLVPAECPEGVGSGPGERLFRAWLSSAGDGPEKVVERARKQGLPAGGQRAVMVARAQSMARIGIVGSRYPDEVRACGLLAFEELDEAVRGATEWVREKRILVVPRALTSLVEVMAAGSQSRSTCG